MMVDHPAAVSVAADVTSALCEHRPQQQVANAQQPVLACLATSHTVSCVHHKTTCLAITYFATTHPPPNHPSPTCAVWWGAFAGIATSIVCGGIFAAVYYVAKSKLFQGTGKFIFQGCISYIACILITYLGFAMLRFANMEQKVARKLDAAAEKVGMGGWFWGVGVWLPDQRCVREPEQRGSGWAAAAAAACRWGCGGSAADAHAVSVSKRTWLMRHSPSCMLTGSGTGPPEPTSCCRH